MGNACYRGCCSRPVSREQMRDFSYGDKTLILEHESVGIGAIMFVYLIIITLFVVASIVPNFGIQREPDVGGSDPTVFRFNALPHVIWMVIPIWTIFIVERARTFTPISSIGSMISMLTWALVMLGIDMAANFVHFIGFIFEGVICDSPLCTQSNTFAFVWVGLSLVGAMLFLGWLTFVRVLVFKADVSTAAIDPRGWGPAHYAQKDIENLRIYDKEMVEEEEDIASKFRPDFNHHRKSKIGITGNLITVGSVFTETNTKNK